MILWTPSAIYQPFSFEREADLEEAIVTTRADLFGPSRIYLDVKRRVGTQGRTINVPDAYLIDLASTRQPRLFVVENELARHEPLRHIAVQILQFSLSFEENQQQVKRIIRNALDENLDARRQCETYAQDNGFQNIDFLLERMIYDGGFSALVIIDELSDELQTVLSSRFKFGVEVLTFARYRNSNGDLVYAFEPFLADITAPVEVEIRESDGVGTRQSVDPSEIDTVVVPARPGGFEETFLAEHRWHAIRIHGSMLPRIKHLAVYRVRPISAITHIASVQSIEPWQNSGYYVVNFTEAPREIGPLKLVPNGRVNALQNLRYTSYIRLQQATNLDEAF